MISQVIHLICNVYFTYNLIISYVYKSYYTVVKLVCGDFLFPPIVRCKLYADTH